MRSAPARVMLGTTLSLVLIACSPTVGSVTSVTIDGGDRSVVAGESLALSATVTTTGDASDAVSWSSGDGSVATIDANGELTALAPGTTTITATSSAHPSKSDTITLTVDPPGVHWTRQFGTSSDDRARSVATDSNGNIYTTGYTEGNLEGTNAGDVDAFIRKYGP